LFRSLQTVEFVTSQIPAISLSGHFPRKGVTLSFHESLGSPLKNTPNSRNPLVRVPKWYLADARTAGWSLLMSIKVAPRRGHICASVCRSQKNCIEIVAAGSAATKLGLNRVLHLGHWVVASSGSSRNPLRISSRLRRRIEFLNGTPGTRLSSQVL
jgi:hypothetical protein